MCRCILPAFCACKSFLSRTHALSSSRSYPPPLLVPFMRRGGNGGGIRGGKRVYTPSQSITICDLRSAICDMGLEQLRFAARRSGTIVQVVLVVATCFGLLGYSHLMALRRRSSSQFHVVRRENTSKKGAPRVVFRCDGSRVSRMLIRTEKKERVLMGERVGSTEHLRIHGSLQESVVMVAWVYSRRKGRCEKSEIEVPVSSIELARKEEEPRQC